MQHKNRLRELKEFIKHNIINIIGVQEEEEEEEEEKEKEKEEGGGGGGRGQRMYLMK